MDGSEFIQLATTGDPGDAQRALQANSALANARNAQGVSIVCLLVYRGRTELAAACASLRSDLDVFEAVCIGDLARVVQLVGADAALANAVSPDGFSPVGYAAFFGHAALLRELIARGGRVNVPSRNAMRVCPLHSAAANSDQDKATELARIVLDAGADPNAQQQGGYTALHEAALNGKLALIELLLARGADRTLGNDQGIAPLALAQKNRHEAAIRLLE